MCAAITRHPSTTQTAGLSPRGALRRLKPAAPFFLLVFAIAFETLIAGGQTETIRVDLRLRTGGALTGLVVDHTDHGLVIVHEDTPYVFAWEELEAGCACGTKHALLAFDRGGDERLLAEDHFQLGMFALSQGATTWRPTPSAGPRSSTATINRSSRKRSTTFGTRTRRRVWTPIRWRKKCRQRVLAW